LRAAVPVRRAAVVPVLRAVELRVPVEREALALPVPDVARARDVVLRAVDDRAVVFFRVVPLPAVRLAAVRRVPPVRVFL
jgi:hypothetical protein